MVLMSISVLVAVAIMHNVDGSPGALFRSWAVPTMEYAEMTSSAAYLSQGGLLGIANVPNYLTLRSQLIHHGYACAQEQGPHGARPSILEDGTQRWTLDEMHAAEGCFEFWQVEHKMKALMQSVVSRLGAALDSELHTPNIQQTLQQSRQIEHFHTYQAAAAPQADTTTMPWHTDQGMLLAFIAPEFHAQNVVDVTQGSGLLLMLDNGEQVSPQLQPEVMYIMIGEQWTHLETKLRISPAVHTLNMIRNEADPNYVRTWYGKMFIEEKKSSIPLPCPYGRRLMAKDGDACAFKKCTSLSPDVDDDKCTELCNTSMKPQQKQCTEKCTCEDEQSEGGVNCWMLCIEDYAADECPAPGQQICKVDGGSVKQETICDGADANTDNSNDSSNDTTGGNGSTPIHAWSFGTLLAVASTLIFSFNN